MQAFEAMTKALEASLRTIAETAGGSAQSSRISGPSRMQTRLLLFSAPADIGRRGLRRSR
jgi:hypothetical protein